RENRRYLPGRRLGPEIQLTADLIAAVTGVEVVIVAVPTGAVRALAGQLRDTDAARAIVVSASKGLEPDSRATLDTVLAQSLPQARIVLLSGPTFAVEIARGLPAAAVVASRALPAAERVQRLFSPDTFRVYTT